MAAIAPRGTRNKFRSDLLWPPNVAVNAIGADLASLLKKKRFIFDDQRVRDELMMMKGLIRVLGSENSVNGEL